MAKEFEVPEKGKAAVENNDPEYKVVLDLGSKGTGPTQIPVGRTTVKIKNTLPEAYGFHFHAINEGKSIADVQNFTGKFYRIHQRFSGRGICHIYGD